MNRYGYEIYKNGFLEADNGDMTFDTRAEAMIDAIQEIEYLIKQEGMTNFEEVHIKIYEEKE